MSTNKLSALLLGGLLLPATLSAQDTYLNHTLTATDNLIGTARYVGMGGAMGALGADLSVISSNPAGIGLYRRSDVAATVSVQRQVEDRGTGEKLAHFSFDNMGFVYSANMGGDKLRFVNFAVNYQKKANYNHVLSSAMNLHGISQSDQLAWQCNRAGVAEAPDGGFYYPTDLAGAAYNAYIFNNDEYGYYGGPAFANRFKRITSGSLQGFDFNLSFNFQDRYYAGLTFGVDNVDYSSRMAYGEYREWATGDSPDVLPYDYGVYNSQSISGYGFNFKLGFIVRPFEESAFRLGFAIETPTFYDLRSSVSGTVESQFDADGNYTPDWIVTHSGVNNRLDYNVRSPWKVRLSAGHTLGSRVALGLEYEYADYSNTKMSYTDTYADDYYYDYWTTNEKDEAMNAYTEHTLKGVHSVKLGIEGRVTDHILLRAGYNYSSKAFKSDARFSLPLNSYAAAFNSSTDYLNRDKVNMFTAGIGYKGRHFYADLAYKYRMQSADFYAFDDSFLGDMYATDPTADALPLQADRVKLNRHEVFMTLGYKF